MSDSANGPGAWDVQSARSLYNIDRWGAKYFDISEAGHVIATPQQEAGTAVDLNDVVEEARARGLKLPLLIRFQDILRHRVQSINESFRNSITEFNYQGGYRGVFPIKVNQLREVVEEILDAGKPYNFGLEVGSKPELFAGLALQADADSLIICNGYKDPNFIRMALMGIKLGKKVIMVVEKLEELKQIISVSRQFGVEPLIGIRSRLLSKGAGKWAESAGENAKFGLSTVELLAAAALLKSENLTHCFQLIHFHIGSQIPSIQAIKAAMKEGARFF
ncbi:MAG TPA: biosynthetic arginine decarboxylase, partial [Candidatus Angelobacter sp.]|nr:biosynthetic arginine decarboxylase [Candidatus Angelobacter sp.]